MFKIRIKSIKTKIHLTIAVMGIIVMSLFLGYSYFMLSRLRIEKIKSFYAQKGNHASALLSSQLNSFTSNLQNNVAILNDFSIKSSESEKLIQTSLKNFLKQNKDITGAWTILKKGNKRSNTTSNFEIFYFYNVQNFTGERKLSKTKIREYSNSKLFTVPTTNNQVTILDLRTESYTGGEFDKINVISIAVPLHLSNGLEGSIGIDIPQSYFQKYMLNFTQTNFSLMLNDKNKIIAHSSKKIINSFFKDYYASLNNNFDILKRIKDKQKQFDVEYSQSKNNKILFIFPFKVNKQQLSIVYSVQIKSQSFDEFSITKLIFLLIFFAGLIAIYIIGRIIIHQIDSPLTKINSSLKQLAKGEINSIPRFRTNRIDEISKSYALINAIKIGFKKIISFSEEIKNGDYDVQYTPFGENDTLGNSLIGLQKNLKELKESQIRINNEEKIRAWVNDGISHFASFLRSHSKNLTEFSNELIKELVDYTKMEIGGIYLFIQNRRKKNVLKLIASYAYDRNKYIDIELQEREGLPGTCAAEKATIYLEKIPNDYISIATGIGTTPPKSLILIPLKVESRVIGVLELASLEKLDSYKINFFEKLSENIALTIASVQINEKTDKLLTQLQTNSDELRSQEEELRQNLEELEATQEEASKRQFHLDNLVKAIDNSALTIKFNRIGKIIELNEAFSRLVNNLNIETTEGLFFNELLELNIDSTDFWKNLEKGNIQRITLSVRNTKPKLWLLLTFTPLYNLDGKMDEVFAIGFDYSENYENSLNYKETKAYAEHLEKSTKVNNQEIQLLKKQSEKLKKDYKLYENLAQRILAKVVLDEEANILETNNKLFELLDIKEKSIVGRNLIELSSFNSSKEFNEFWQTLILKKFFERNFVYNNNLYKEFYYIEKTEKGKTITNFILQAGQSQKENESKGLNIGTILNKNMLTAEYNSEGKVLSLSPKLMELFKLNEKDLKRKNHKDFAIVENVLKYHVLWSKLRTGEPQTREMRYEVDKTEYTLIDYYFPIFNDKSEVEKIFSISVDISKLRNHVSLLTKTLNDIKKNKS